MSVRIVCPAGDGFPGLDATTVTDSLGKYLHTVPGIPAGTTVVCTVSIDPASGEANGRVLTTANPQATPVASASASPRSKARRTTTLATTSPCGEGETTRSSREVSPSSSSASRSSSCSCVITTNSRTPRMAALSVMA